MLTNLGLARALQDVRLVAADSHTGKRHGSDLPTCRCICTRKQRHGCHASPAGDHTLVADMRSACLHMCLQYACLYKCLQLPV